MQWILGYYIFGFFGALVRWIYYEIKNVFLRRKLEIRFINIWLGKTTDSGIDDLSNNFVNAVLGFFDEKNIRDKQVSIRLSQNMV